MVHLMAHLSRPLAVLLCCCLPLRFSWAMGQSGEGVSSDSGGGEGSNSSGSGSGSGAEDMPEEGVIGFDVAECVHDLMQEESEGESLTSSTAYTAAMCSLLCLEDVTNNTLYQDIELRNRTIDGVGLFETFPQFNSDNHQRNCHAFKEYGECVRGCLVGVEPTRPDGNCKKQCVSECREERDSNGYYFNPYCPISCNGMICKKGCEKYENIVRSSNTLGSPPTPVRPPQIILSYNSGEMLLDITQTVSFTNEQETPHTLTAIVYCVTDQITNVTRYFYKAFPEDPLSLEDFACRTVYLSFVLVNAFGASGESPPLTFTIPGGDIHVRPPTNIRITDQDADRRPGFFGHAVLTISWSQPEGFTALHYYIVTVQRFTSHTESKLTSPPITSTNWTVLDSEETRVLLLGYNIRIIVCTKLWSRDTNECVEKIATLKTMNSFISFTLTCSEPHWDGSRYTVSLHWTVPQFIAYGDAIFSEFFIEGEEVITKRYLDTVAIQWLNSDLYQKPTNIPKTCQVSAEPPSPSPVQNESVTLFYQRAGEEAVRITELSCSSQLNSTAHETISDRLWTLEQKLDSVPDITRLQSVMQNVLNRLRTIESKVDQIIDALSQTSSGE